MTDTKSGSEVNPLSVERRGWTSFKMAKQSWKVGGTDQLSTADGVTSHDTEGNRKRGSTYILFNESGGTG